MPLLQSLEDDRVKKLKSLKYPSGQAPYVQKDILDPPAYNALSTPITKRLDDLERITKMLTDAPGIKFAANQALLGGVRGAAKALGSIVKQVPVSGTGLHFYQVPRSSRYAKIKGANQAKYRGEVAIPFDQLSNFIKTNRDDTLVKTKTSIYDLDTSAVPSSLTREESLGPIEDTYDRSSPLRDSRASGSEFDLLSSRVDSTVDPSDYYNVQGLVEVGSKPEGNTPAIQDRLDRSDPLKDVLASGSELVDLNLGGVLENQTNGSHFTPQGLVETGNSPIGEKKAIVVQKRKKPDQYYDKELSLGNQAATYETDGNGNFKLDKDGNKIIKPGLTDYVNLGDFNDDPNADELHDLIDFRFSVNGTLLAFRAHLTAFDDTHTGNWNSHQYIGRADQFYTYQGYSRGVTIGFMIAATSQTELQPLYRKLNYLASANAPRYSGNNFMQGTVARVTVGDYLKRTPGVINSVGLNWQTDYPWDINLYGDSKQLPMVLNATVNLSIIHKFTPQVNTTSASSNSPFFAKDYVTDPNY